MRAATSRLAFRHVAYLASAFCGFLRCHLTSANSGYYQHAISDGSTVVDSVTDRRCCAPGGPVSTWAVNGTARTIVPPVGFPTRESEHAPGVKPETFLRNRRHGRSPDVDPVWPHGSPKPETRPVLRKPGRLSGGKPRCCPLSAQVTDRPTEKSRCRTETLGRAEPESQSETAARGFGSRSPHPSRGSVNMHSNNCVSRPSRGRPISRDSSRTYRLQWREHLGTLNPEFPFAGSMTQGSVSLHATNSRLKEPVFGRRIDAETGDWTIGPGNTQAIPRHNFPASDVCDYPCRTPAAAAGSAQIGLCNPDRMTMVPGVLSMNSALIQFHNQLPYNRTNNVTRCHIQNASSWPSMFFLMNCRRLTVSSYALCHVCQHWHKPIIPSRSLPSLVFLFLRHFQKIQQELQNPPVDKSHQFASVLRSREALYSPLELSSTGFFFSQDSCRRYELHRDFSVAARKHDSTRSRGISMTSQPWLVNRIGQDPPSVVPYND